MWSYRQTVEPLVEPVSLTETKLHLRVTVADEDVLIRNYLAAARRYVEGFTRRQLVTATWELLFDAWPTQKKAEGEWFRWGTYGGEILIPMPPLQSVTSIVYIDSNGASQTLATSVYEIDTTQEPGIVRLKYGQSWPGLRAYPGAVKVTYVAGHGAQAAIPQDLKLALFMLVAHYYERREPIEVGTITKEVELGVRSLLWSRRARVA